MRGNWQDLRRRSATGRYARQKTAVEAETTYDSQIVQNADNAHEVVSTGAVSLTGIGDIIYMGGDDVNAAAYIAGFRYQNVPMAQGVTLPIAQLDFFSSNGNGEPTTLRIWAEDVDNAAAFAATNGNLSGRTKTSAYVDWPAGLAWSTDQHDADTITPDLSPVLEEVFARGGWVPGNAVVFLVEFAPGTDNVFPRRRTYAYSAAPTKTPRLLIGTSGSGGGGEPVVTDLEIRLNPSFAITDIDNTITDENGVTVRTWYQRMKNSMARRGSGTVEDDFNGNSNRPWGRTGNMWATQALIGVRYFGDPDLFDEVVRLTEMAWGVMGSSETLSSTSNTTLASSPITYDFWGGDDQELDVPLTAGLLACVAWACHNNRDLTSPAGYNYGAIADKYKAWLLRDFIQRWQEKDALKYNRDPRYDDLPPFSKGQGHTWVNMIRTLWYLGRLGGGNGNSAQDYFDAAAAMLTRKLDEDRVCSTGMDGGRGGRVYMHSNTSTVGGTGTSDSLQYTTYVRYEISAYIDLLLEGYDSRLDTNFFRTWAASLADRMLDGDPENTGDPCAGTIGGDLLSRNSVSCSSSGDNPGSEFICGIHYHHCFRGRISAERLLEYGSYGMLAGWDVLGKVDPYMNPYYPTLGSVETPSFPGYVGSRFFTMMFHGEGSE